METYTLIVLVALFLGVMGIIAMLERRRRTELEQAKQLHETLTACVGWLQAIHSGGEAQMGKVETAIKSSSESAAKLSSTAIRAVEQAASHLETAVQEHQKALNMTLVRAADKLSGSADKLSESSAARTKELLAEAQHTTKAVQDLQASLEASAKF